MGATEQPRRLLGEILVEMLLISEDQLEQALETQKETGQFLGEILVAHGCITRHALGDALGVQRALSSEPQLGLGGGFEARTASEPATLERLPSPWLGQRRSL